MYNFRKILTNESFHTLKYRTSCIPGPCCKKGTKKMKALQFAAKSKKLQLVQLPFPTKLGTNDVLIKVYYAGICSTDLHIVDGDFPCKMGSPVVLGHEFSGVVEEVGSKTENVKVGDKVVCDPNVGCNACDVCRRGKPNYCKRGGLRNTLGIYRNGGWAEYCIVRDKEVHKVPSSLTLKQAALCEPLSCISHSWDIISPIFFGQKILLVGSGIIGNLFASLLHVQGHRNVTISDPSPERLHILQQLEIGYELVTPKILESYRKGDSNYLFDIVIECSGKAKAAEHAFTMLNYGGKLFIFGCANPKEVMCLSPFEIFRKELRIHGMLVNPFSFPKALKILDIMGERYIDYDKLGIQLFSMDQHSEAITRLRKGKIAKATFQIQQE